MIHGSAERYSAVSLRKIKRWRGACSHHTLEVKMNKFARSVVAANGPDTGPKRLGVQPWPTLDLLDDINDSRIYICILLKIK